MRGLKKKLQAKAFRAKENLDTAILNLKNARLEQLMNKLDQAKSKIEYEGDIAWNIATRVLAKVKSVREQMSSKTSAAPKRKSIAKSKTQTSKKAKPKIKMKKSSRPPLKRSKKSAKASMRA